MGFAFARLARLGIVPLVTLAALSSTPPAAAATSTGASTAANADNPAPDVVPSLREWSGGQGVLTLGQGSRVVIDPAGGRSLAGEGRTFAADLAGVSGLELPVVSGPSPRPGDVFLSRAGAGTGLGSEGYRLTVGAAMAVRGATDAGVFYGTQTVLQMLKTAPGHRSVPRGEARDWPAQRERGFLLDAGRKFYSPDFIVAAIREMAYLRLNTVQFHFSDHNAFRLVSKQLPWLAAPQAYTRADIARFEAVARQYHVTIIPEIEMPAHASAILRGRPDLAFDCPALSGGTLDVTKPAARALTKALIDEFAPLFSGPEFHLATDEYPRGAEQAQCPELVNYARDHGFGSPSDVFVDFINEMNRVVRSHGKQTVIWNWWDVDQSPTISPDKNIKVEAWTTAAESGQDHSAQKYLDQGYEVVASPSDLLYVTPGFPLLPDPKALYEQWEPMQHPRLAGYQISVWSDNAITRPDSYFDAYLRRPREVLADRLWGGPRRGTVADFFARADAIGTPPGVAGYRLPGTITGTPYGTSPSYDNSSSTFDKAFDGDPITIFLYSQPDGGYTGLDRGAGQDSPVSLVRFFPGANDRELERMTGGRFEGCTDGPSSGCHTLATIDALPVFGWNELPVTDPGRYRWLRYVGPDGGYGDVAELEFVAAPEAAAPVTVQGPPVLRQLGENEVTTTFHNTTGAAVRGLTFDLTASGAQDRSDRTVRALGPTEFAAVRPGGSVSTRWQVEVPLQSATGTYHLVGHTTYQRAGAQAREDAAGFTRSAVDPALETSLTPATVALDAGDSAGTTLSASNHAARPVTLAWHEVRLPTANPGFTIAPDRGSITVPAGGTATASLTASASSTATGVTSPLRLDFDVAASGQPASRAGSEELRIRSRTHPYLSDLDWVEATSEWSTVSRDTYVGSSDPMTLNGVRYAKGLGAAGNSKVTFELPSGCTRFTSAIGIDDAADFTTDGGTSHFFVVADGRQIYESGLITRDIVKDVDLDITGVRSLSLVTDNAGDGFDHDAVDWADARVSCS